MTKTHELAAAFLQKAQSARSIPVRSSINAFHSLFAVQELTEHETRTIERIFVEGFEPGLSAEETVDHDALEVKRLTKELRAIKRQEQVLIGERIAQARDVFRRYKTRSFREWMELTFGSYKTGYNYLAFHDFYMAVPEELKVRLKEMPAKAVYILASNKAPMEQKIGIVREHSQETAQNLIALIRLALNQGHRFSQRPVNDKIINTLEKGASLLVPSLFDQEQRRRLALLVAHLKDLIDHSKKLAT